MLCIGESQLRDRNIVDACIGIIEIQKQEQLWKSSLVILRVHLALCDWADAGLFYTRQTPVSSDS